VLGTEFEADELAYGWAQLLDDLLAHPHEGGRVAVRAFKAKHRSLRGVMQISEE